MQIGRLVQQPTHQVFHHANHMKVMEHSFCQKQPNVVHGVTHLFYLHLVYFPQVVHNVVLQFQATQLIAKHHVADQQKVVIVL